jgi:polar amino acid transport system permease protein/polar amino acid transport system substrate-binding protein
MVCISALSLFIIKVTFSEGKTQKFEEHLMSSPESVQPKLKKSKMRKFIKPLIILGVCAMVAVTVYILLFMPLNNPPLWITSLREAFFSSAFYIDFENNFIAEKRYNYIVKGLGTTFTVTFFAVLLGIALGVIVALVRSSYDTLKEEMKGGFGKALLWFFYKLCGIYLTVIRGTPVVVQLMIIYFVIFASSNNKILVAVLAFGINSGAYVAEIIRGGIMSIDRGQFEAGRSLGFGYVRTMAFIIIPQAFKTVLPALANEFIVLIKETSVSGYVGLQELTKGGDIIRSRTYSAFMPLIAVAIIYLVIVMFFSWLVSLLERRLKNSER